MNKSRGFTLLEVMITVVIIAVLATIAVTSYSGYACRSKQANAHTSLKALQLAMEQYRSRVGAYFPSSSNLEELPGADMYQTTTPHYTLTIINSSQMAFTARATCRPSDATRCNLDSDARSDEWEINQDGTLTNISNDCD